MERANLYPDEIQTETGVSSNEKQCLAARPLPSPVEETSRKSKQINLAQLINKLNAINFLDKYLYINFRHKRFRRFLTFKAKPTPCQNDHLTCLWQQDVGNLVAQPNCYEFGNILIPDGKRFITAIPEVVEIDSQGIQLLLPETCNAEDVRSARRHGCRDVHVYVTQNGALFYGSMVDFSAFSFRVRVKTAPPQTFAWVNADLPVNVIFFDGDKTLYSGDCQIFKQTHGHNTQEWVLTITNREIRRFRPKEFRSTRQKMVPLPTISFHHPLSKNHIQLEVMDLSGTGLAVKEESKHAVLLPGLIIPDLRICFSDGATVTCSAQVVYSKPVENEEEKGMLRCGVAILDMDADEHVKILSLIQQTDNKNTYLCNRVNSDDLWNFFFETGFIYPEKYEYIERNKSLIKQTYKKLYTAPPQIARHFIYQKNGSILAHMAMVRFYEKAWLIHHHAALRTSTNRGGLAVLNQIGSFINDSHRINSIRMNYVFCFFRPENKFPSHVFGGAAKNIQNQKGCSIDQFAYFHFSRKKHGENSLPPGWAIVPVTDSDLRDLECHYEEKSSGLMIQALDLGYDNHDISETEAAFAQIGLLRSRHLYALKMSGDLKVVFMVNIADIGLNMSDLTNSIKMFIVRHEGLNYQIIRACLRTLIDQFQLHEMPVLTFPATSAEALAIPFEKRYNLWILNMNHTDDYFRYLKRLLKFIKH